jgi:DNA-binding CsgD family transcriptional regulator
MMELTNRQQEIADLLMAGAEARSICQRLSIKPECLRAHLSDMRERLHVKTQAELTAVLRARTRNPLPAMLDACRRAPKQWWTV